MKGVAMRSLRFLGFVALTFLFMSGGPYLRGQAGVQVVKNPRKPVAVAGQPSSLTLKEDLVIGLTGESENELFAQLQSVDIDDRENIWTLDRKDIKIRIFDKNGKPLITFGKQGQGPNELQTPFRMLIKRDGTAAIMDTGKLAYYAIDGTCVKEFSMARIRSFRIAYDSQGLIYLDSMDFAVDPATRTSKRVYKITKFDAELNPLKVFAIAEDTAAIGNMSVFTPTLYFQVTSKDRIIWAFGEKAPYEFNVMNSEGQAVQKITKDYEPRKITATEEKALMGDRFGNQLPPGIKATFPASYPPLGRFLTGDDDRIYARTMEPDGKGGTWIDIFEPEGRYITRTALPEKEIIFGIKRDKLYVILPEDAEGRPLVKRYAMIWK